MKRKFSPLTSLSRKRRDDMPEKDWFSRLMKIAAPPGPATEPHDRWWKMAMTAARDGHVACQLVVANVAMSMYENKNSEQLEAILKIPSTLQNGDNRAQKKMKLTFHEPHVSQPFTGVDQLLVHFEDETPVIWNRFVATWFLHDSYDIECMNTASFILYPDGFPVNWDRCYEAHQNWFIEEWMSPWFDGPSDRKQWCYSDVNNEEVLPERCFFYGTNTLLCQQLRDGWKGKSSVAELVANVARDPESLRYVLDLFVRTNVLRGEPEVEVPEGGAFGNHFQTATIHCLLDIASITAKEYHDILRREGKQKTILHFFGGLWRPQHRLQFPFVGPLLDVLADIETHMPKMTKYCDLVTKQHLLVNCTSLPLRLAIQLYPSTPLGLIQNAFLPHIPSLDLSQLILEYAHIL